MINLFKNSLIYSFWILIAIISVSYSIFVLFPDYDTRSRRANIEAEEYLKEIEGKYPQIVLFSSNPIEFADRYWEMSRIDKSEYDNIKLDALTYSCLNKLTGEEGVCKDGVKKHISSFVINDSEYLKERDASISFRLLITPAASALLLLAGIFIFFLVLSSIVMVSIKAISMPFTYACDLIKKGKFT